MKRLLIIVGALLLLQAPPLAQEAKGKLKVGVTLHAYYSWASMVGGNQVEVVPLLKAAADPNDYQPTADEIKKLSDLDAVVINGLGHDDFIHDMIKASGNKKLTIIKTATGIPLIPIAKAHSHGKEKQAQPDTKGNTGALYNSHTFIGIHSAITQVFSLERAFSKLRPKHAKTFRKQARAYAKKLRLMMAKSQAALAEAKPQKIATIHDAYAYLFQEFGLTVDLVIEPQHGIAPSAKELQAAIEKIKKEKITLLFGEKDFAKDYHAVLAKETKVRFFTLSHISAGKYTAGLFEERMQENLDVLIKALAPTKKK